MSWLGSVRSLRLLDRLVGIQTLNIIVSILGGTYGSREREISSNDVKRGDDCLQAELLSD
jgi:hypothetical protein